MASTCISVESFKSWEKSGRTDFVKLCKSLAESNGIWSSSAQNIKRAFYDLCWCVLKGQLKQEQCVSTLNECMDHLKDMPSILSDVLAVIDVETSTGDDKTQRDKFISLTVCLVALVSEALLKERLDQETLEAVGLIASKQQFQQKYVKTKTKLYYKQQKFNLLREESEGYSKLITELNQEITRKLSYEQVLENIKSMIGCFDLDPNRVLDIMLEAFECRPEHEAFYIPLFRAYMTDKLTLCHVLGFHFHFYEPNANMETPASLFNVAAYLLKHSLVDLDDLYQHLLPSDSDIAMFHNKELTEAKAYARKLSLVILSDKKEDDKDKDDIDKVDLRVNNQKLGLCEALLRIGAWENAKAILDRLPAFFATAHKPIAQALCSHIHEVIEPVYEENNGLPSMLMKKRNKVCANMQASEKGVHSFQQLHLQAFPMVCYLGPYASIDPILLVKFIRLGKTFLTKRHEGGIDPEDDVAFYGFMNVLDEVVLPSLSLLPCNCCMSEELWGLLKLLPYELRYRLYGQWKNDNYGQHAVLIRVRADTLERAKYIMKRLTKETVKPSGRQLGKLSHSNPGVVFEYVLSQIQRYDNFIGPVVDSLKYLTSMSYDVLTYCVIEAVANPEKERLKHDDTNISLWLQSLANFTGSICRKYQVELSGVMQYVANQLKTGKSFDLLLLRDVVQKMAGIEITEEITDDQLEAMSGGELLRQEGGYFAQVRNTKKSSTRLKDTLLEHNLAVTLCLLMAQQREGVVFQEGQERHLKLVGKLYDQCQDTLVQFGSFLSMQLSTEEFIKRLPPIDILISTYHLPHNAAFFLSRPVYSYNINAKYEELRKIDKSNKQTSSQNKTQRYIEASEEVMRPVMDVVHPLMSEKIWDDMSTQFYLTFWSLSMYDLFVPNGAYEKQSQQLSAQMAAVEENKDMPQSKKRKERERCNNLMDKLREEEKKQGDHVSRVMARLKHEKEQWFPTAGSAKNETITHFLQLCIFPRCCFTASDAVFCAKFIHTLHNLKTPNFSTLICYDRIFCDVTYSVTSCTENEAHRYGRFLCGALDTIMKWHSDKAMYEKECANYPGFVTIFRKSPGTENTNKQDRLDYENYRHVCHKWHFRLTKAIIACLESGNYTQIRNALIILTRILPHYPRIVQFGSALERRVDRLSKEEKEKRPDIYALAMGYSGQLKSKKSLWVAENDFHIKEPKPQTKAANGPLSRGDASSGTGNSISKDGGPKKSDSTTKSRENTVEDKDSHENSERREKADGQTEKKEKVDKEKKSDKGDKKDSRNKEFSGGDKKPNSDNRNGVSRPRSKEKHSGEKEKEKSPKERTHNGEKAKEKTEKESKKREERVEMKSGREESHVAEEKSSIKPLKRPKEELEKTSKDKEKESRMKREKEEARETRKEEKHEKRIKLEREKEKIEERSSSGGVSNSGNSSTHRRSMESSPMYSDDRESKRRKMDGPSNTKDIQEPKSKQKHLPSEEKDIYEKERKEDREKDRKERKRDHSLEHHDAADTKKRRSEELTLRSKVNGESDASVKKHGHSQERDTSRDRTGRHGSPPYRSSSKRDVTEAADEVTKSKVKEKKVSSKKSKK